MINYKGLEYGEQICPKHAYTKVYLIEGSLNTYGILKLRNPFN